MVAAAGGAATLARGNGAVAAPIAPDLCSRRTVYQNIKCDNWRGIPKHGAQ